MKPLEILLLGGVAIYILNKISTASIASTLNFRISDVSINGGNPIINIVAQNPQNAGFVINSMVGNVYLNETSIGNISMFQQIPIAPLGETTIPVLIRLSLLGALENVKSWIRGELHGVDITVRGSVNVDGIIAPLNIELLNT